MFACSSLYLATLTVAQHRATRKSGRRSDREWLALKEYHLAPVRGLLKQLHPARKTLHICRARVAAILALHTLQFKMHCFPGSADIADMTFPVL